MLGPRRVGKTTCLYQAVRHLLKSGVDAKRIWWLRLDHPLLMPAGLEWVNAIRADADAHQPIFVFLDELNYANDWDLWLKTFYDERWPIRLAGSSSSTAVLRSRRLESGVGRWEEQYLAPYLFGEFLDLLQHNRPLPIEPTLAETVEACIAASPDVTDLGAFRQRFLLTGGFPELLLSDERERERDTPEDDVSLLLRSQRRLRDDAVERAIYKDIPQAFSIDSPMVLERLLYVLAAQVTGLLSPQTVCKELGGLSQPTLDRYLSYLEHAFLIFLLPNYSGSERKVQRRGRRVYFVDGAVRNAALQRGAGPLNDPTEMGVLYENLVAGHLHALARQTQVRLYHWRYGNHEVDLVYDHPEHPIAFEIGSTARHPTAGLRQFITRHPRFSGRCYLVAPNVPAIRTRGQPGQVGLLPLDLLLLAISRQADAALHRRLAV